MTNPETSSDLVKRLEWQQSGFGGSIWRAHSMLGIHRVAMGSTAGWSFEGYDGTEVNQRADTVEDAKAACQADYAARILSAIDATTIERLTAERDEDAARWQKLRDLFGMDGWYDGKWQGIPEPNSILTHIEFIANERARLLLASVVAESLNARQAEVLKAIADRATEMQPNSAGDYARCFGDLLRFIETRAALATESSNLPNHRFDGAVEVPSVTSDSTKGPSNG